MLLPFSKGKKYGVFGLGKSGVATVASLAESGAEVFAWDDTEKSRQGLGVLSEHLSEVENWPWAELSSLILSPGVPLTHPHPHPIVERAKSNGVEIIGDVELLYRAYPDATYIGITGTNGKSTTTALTGHILQSAGLNVQVGGNIGMPVLGLVSPSAKDIMVLELSSFQLDLVNTTRFNYSLLLNITQDHLDRHGDMIGYVNAKRNIFSRQTPKDIAIIGVDDNYCIGLLSYLSTIPDRPRTVTVSREKEIPGGVSFYDAAVYAGLNPNRTCEFDLHGMSSLRGWHNYQNAAFAIAVALCLGLDTGPIFSALETFQGLPHRMEVVGKLEGVEFINDSKATNADAAAKALEVFENIYWIAGGLPKAGGISTLESYFPRIRKAYLIGDAQKDFASTLEGRASYKLCGNMQSAFEAAVSDVMTEKPERAVVLLSPACASYDQWPNFEVRGDAFRDMVKTYLDKLSSSTS
jgi:UDP-N-acetylmuramoylalanine--D-glutamate ligase